MKSAACFAHSSRPTGDDLLTRFVQRVIFVT